MGVGADVHRQQPADQADGRGRHRQAIAVAGGAAGRQVEIDLDPQQAGLVEIGKVGETDPLRHGGGRRRRRERGQASEQRQGRPKPMASGVGHAAHYDAKRRNRQSGPRRRWGGGEPG